MTPSFTMARTHLFVSLIAAALHLCQAASIANYTAFPELQTISEPFHVAGRAPGSVSFGVLPLQEPTRYGVPLLGYNLTKNHTLGYPTVYGKVSSPNSLGYASEYGWVQVIAVSNNTLPEDDKPWIVDIISSFKGLNYPFVFYGPEATFFDLAFPIGNVEEQDVVAHTFLTYLPNPIFSKAIVPLVAFEWGYWVINGTPKAKQLKRLDLDVWNSHLPLFNSNFTGWKFTELQQQRSRGL